MRATPARLVHIIPRSALPSTATKRPPTVHPAPAPHPPAHTPLLQVLMERRDALGKRWPPNLRIEPVVKKAELAGVDASVRTQLKALLREK